MLRRNLLKSLSVLPFLSVLKLQIEQKEKPFRTETNEYSNGSWLKYTYDKNGKELTFESSYGLWSKHTYDHDGKELTFENSDGFWYKKTYDQNGNLLNLEVPDRWKEAGNIHALRRGFARPIRTNIV